MRVFNKKPKESYEAVLPRKSFIFVDDYPDLKNLIDHLHYLDLNDQAYMEYFRWRLDPPENLFGFNLPNSECELCLKLQDDGDLRVGRKFANGESEFGERMVVGSIHDWVHDEVEECLEPEVFYLFLQSSFQGTF